MPCALQYKTTIQLPSDPTVQFLVERQSAFHLHLHSLLAIELRASVLLAKSLLYFGPKSRKGKKGCKRGVKQSLEEN